MRRASLVIVALLALCGPVRADAPTDKALAAALAGPPRTAQSTALDAARHPVETFKFFGARSDMAMMEVWPADAWWTEIVGPVIAEHGHYVVALDDQTGLDTPLTDRIHALSILYPFNYGKIEFAPFGPPLLMHPVPTGSQDFAFTFDALHRALSDVRPSMLSGILSSLKPGGTFGLIEARTTGMTEADVIKLVENAGFKLIAKSELSAKAAGGEPSRSTLLFEKPQR